MKLKKYVKKKNVNLSLFLGITSVVMLLGGIYLYKTYALYEEKKEFNVLKGRIGDFRENQKDIEIAAIVDGKVTEKIPSKEEYIVEEVICTNGAEAKWNNESWEITIRKLSESGTTCSLYFYPKQLNEFIIAKSRGNESIEKFEHEETEQTPSLTDYRYVGENPNNYVCFGSEESPCPEENLYRIIGVIPTQSEENGEFQNRVKLIKNSFYIEEESGFLATELQCNNVRPSYSIKADGWSKSPLNQVVLNKVYWNSLGEYQKFIISSIWYLGAISTSSNSFFPRFSPNMFYLQERSYLQGYSDEEFNTLMNVGLMYPSDYAFSVGTKYSNQYIYDNKETYKLSWLYILENQYKEWLLSPTSGSNALRNMYIHSDADLDRQVVGCTNEIRPSFYLKENIGYKSGNGSKDNPYIIYLIN